LSIDCLVVELEHDGLCRLSGLDASESERVSKRPFISRMLVLVSSVCIVERSAMKSRIVLKTTGDASPPGSHRSERSRPVCMATLLRMDSGKLYLSKLART
jgi:hypothetical protein